MAELICTKNTCPVCEVDVIPGLDYCFCRNCRGYYPTATGIRMEKEREQKKADALAARRASKQSAPTLSFGLDRDSMSYSHHEFEDQL